MSGINALVYKVEDFLAIDCMADFASGALEHGAGQQSIDRVVLGKNYTHVARPAGGLDEAAKIFHCRCNMVPSPAVMSRNSDWRRKGFSRYPEKGWARRSLYCRRSSARIMTKIRRAVRIRPALAAQARSNSA